MFYLSPTLTLLMLGVVPPISLGAVRDQLFLPININSSPYLGLLWKISEEAFKPDPGSAW